MALTEPVLRRHDLPAAAVRAATERRLAGDWQGACAAAGVEVDASVLAWEPRMLDDLRHLTPDLLRWHLLDGGLKCARGVQLPLLLAQYPRGLALVVHPHFETYGPHRLRLSTDTAWVRSRWDSSRHLWDARHATRLPHRLGGGDRTPGFHRDGRRLDRADLPQTAPAGHDRAATAEWEQRLVLDDRLAGWRAAGVEIDPTVTAAFNAAGALLPFLRMSLVVPAAWDLLGAGARSGTVLVTRLPQLPDQALTLTLCRGAGAVLRVDRWRCAQRLPAVPETALNLPWFVEALRCGWLPISAVHPLVRAAMFPDAPDTPYAPAAGVRVPERIHVQCGSHRHYVGWRDGRLAALSHTPDDVCRERALQALGGRSTGCLAVLDNWSARTGPLPRQIRIVARHMLLAAGHGDVAEVHRLLDAGVDPRGVRGVQRRSLLHMAHLIGDVALIRRLRAAGLDPTVPDGHGHSALRVAQAMGASAAILSALR
ncbi:hypothetical protein [Dactylosporangium sp. NPDC050588]|uniref:hypothetical protein n=1 Tax=Dactylosporangium sp. NPDC050588 TaxID=3157211 RepID=UPI0033ECB3D8